MDIVAVLNIILPIVFIIVGVALVWFLVELARTVKTARKTVLDIHEEITPTLAHVQKITEDIQPAVAKIDPLVERVSLTVDAANLEMMRVDTILEDVAEITDTLSSTTNAIDSVANAPLNMVNNMSNRVHGILKGRRSSESASSLAQAKVDADREAALQPEGAAAEEPVAEPASAPGQAVDQAYVTIKASEEE